MKPVEGQGSAEAKLTKVEFNLASPNQQTKFCPFTSLSSEEHISICWLAEVRPEALPLCIWPLCVLQDCQY